MPASFCSHILSTRTMCFSRWVRLLGIGWDTQTIYRIRRCCNATSEYSPMRSIGLTLVNILNLSRLEVMQPRATSTLATCYQWKRHSQLLTNVGALAAAEWSESRKRRFSGTRWMTPSSLVVIRPTRALTFTHFCRRVAKARLSLLCSRCAARSQDKGKWNTQHRKVWQSRHVGDLSSRQRWCTALAGKFRNQMLFTDTINI